MRRRRVHSKRSRARSTVRSSILGRYSCSSSSSPSRAELSAARIGAPLHDKGGTGDAWGSGQSGGRHIGEGANSCGLGDRGVPASIRCPEAQWGYLSLENNLIAPIHREGLSEGIGIRNAPRELSAGDRAMCLRVDASACEGVLHRSGEGKVEHLATKQFWIQGLIQSCRVGAQKVPHAENTSDVQGVRSKGRPPTDGVYHTLTGVASMTLESSGQTMGGVAMRVPLVSVDLAHVQAAYCVEAKGRP